MESVMSCLWCLTLPVWGRSIFHLFTDTVCVLSTSHLDMCWLEYSNNKISLYYRNEREQGLRFG